MQVVNAIDIEDALRLDVGAIIEGARVFAPPLPPDLKGGDVLIERVGGSTVSGASDEYDVTVGCYADTAAEAVALANAVKGAIVSLPLRGLRYGAADAGLPYSDYDPRAPRLSRQSFRASVTCSGERIEF